MKSRFKLWAFLPPILVIFLMGLFCFLAKDALKDDSPSVLFVYGILYVMIVATWLWAVFGELRTKTIAVSIENDSILVKRYLGIGPTQAFPLAAFDGFHTSMLSSNYGEYEYLYLMDGHKKVVKISEFYHRNYFEMKGYLVAKVKNLGDMPFSMREEFQEIFQ